MCCFERRGARDYTQVPLPPIACSKTSSVSGRGTGSLHLYNGAGTACDPSFAPSSIPPSLICHGPADSMGGGGAGAALQLGFDGPGEGGAVVFGEQDVGAEGVKVFGVEEEAVHVEKTGADGCWRGHCV